MYEEAQKEFKTKVIEEIQKQQDMAVNATRDDEENLQPAASDH